ncbi:integrase [Pseudomonas sp. EA_105y_Pfl2_R69]|uniref:integrase n=1 Tax=Pseudomonas sp. EA_105y_Pfl2_R69 TaxID=3088683 RepID=UPI0030D7657B
MSLSDSLSFLNDIHDLVDITSSWWLKSDFYTTIWKYQFHKKVRSFNWNIRLNDGSLLTDSQHAQTLNTLRSFLIVSTMNCSARGLTSNAIKTQHVQFRCTLKLIDYLLINDAKYALYKYGIEGLSSDDLKSILKKISSDKNTCESIYSWTSSLGSFCMDLVENTPTAIIESVHSKYPEILVVTPDQAEQHNLNFPIELLSTVRACLFAAGLYRRPDRSEHKINSVKISERLYTNTLSGRMDAKPNAPSLSFFLHAEPFEREYEAVPVTTGARTPMGPSAFSNYQRALSNLAILHDYNLPVPPMECLTEISRIRFEHSGTGRFRTLPTEVAFSSLRNAIEFHYQHAETLKLHIKRISLYCEVFQTKVSTLNEETYAKLNTHQPDAVEVGLSKIGLSARTSGQFHTTLKGSRASYFDDLRRNAGLIEMLRIYIACVQITVGMLCARRIGELIDLLLADCLDETKSWLIFILRKSTKSLHGIRAEEARPVPPIAAEMIETLIYFHSHLCKISRRRMKSLFSSPHKSSFHFIEASATTFNRNLDLFCDYTQTPLDSLGRRYYVRQHQFRRFFALLFFKCNNFAGLDTLRWMLGHTELRQVWRYIQENVDGATICGAEAQHIAEVMTDPNHGSAYEDLAELIRAEYGVDSHSLVDTTDLENSIFQLIEEGRVEVEPIFFKAGDGEYVKIIVIIKE